MQTHAKVIETVFLSGGYLSTSTGTTSGVLVMIDKHDDSRSDTESDFTFC
jgi:hypothetical protein